MTIQVGVEDSQLVHWDLYRSKLQSLLQVVIDQAITHRFLDEDPNLVLNLSYGEVSEHPIVFIDRNDSHRNPQ